MPKLSEKDRELLKVLLVHWINHNGEHINSYVEYRNKLIESHPAISKEIASAVEKMQAASTKLMEAKVKGF